MTSKRKALGNQPWDIHAAFSGDFVGGVCTLTYKVDGTEYSYDFKIRGKNPKDSTAKSYIQTNLSGHPYAWAIAQHETRQGTRSYNQFNSGGLAERPNRGAPDGWGIFQIDRSGSGGSTSTQEVYNWHVNLNAAQVTLDDKKDTMERFFRWIKNKWGNDPNWEEPPQNVNFGQSPSQFAPLELGTIVLYNGARGVATYGVVDDNGNNRTVRTPWRFDRTRPAGQRWYFDDNVNNYAQKVVEDEWEGGQTLAE